MLHASELQIGDWVKYSNPPYIKVQNITKHKIGYHLKPNEPRMHYVRLCEVEPIPLTPEILEKNGFVLENFSGEIMKGKWWTREDFVFPKNMNDSIGKNNFKYEYVHQLQHALRLCGIKKEITLNNKEL